MEETANKQVLAPNRTSLIEGFPPVARRDARALILGSMPGRASLEVGRYYAHPRNAFWPIMAELLGFRANAPYRERIAALRRSRVALWDVLRQCRRASSMDADILAAGSVANDFDAFFGAHPGIQWVFCNGAKAHSLFQRQRRASGEGWPDRIDCMRLPSTSPAHAALSFAGKLAAWLPVRESAMGSMPAASACRGRQAR